MQASIGDIVKIHFTCKIADGMIVDSTIGKSPLQFTLGKSEIMPYLEKAIFGMEAGESKTIKIPVNHAFGEFQNGLIFQIDKKILTLDVQLVPGIQINIENQFFKVLDVSNFSIILDANHPLAGKELFYDIQIIDIQKNKSYLNDHVSQIIEQRKNISESTQIAILLTTFLRDNLMHKTLQNIINHWNESYFLLIGDQGCKSVSDFEMKSKVVKQILGNHIPYKYYHLPFDCGLSASRNFLVNKANYMKINYCFLIADSIQFIRRYDLNSIISFLEEDNMRGIIGFDLRNRPSWEYDLELIKYKFFHLQVPKRNPIEYKGIQFQPVDICRNFFLAKTDCLLLNPWDETLKLAEHEDFFWQLKKSSNNYQVFWTNFIQAQYINEKPFLYNQMRNRIYSKFYALVLRKYNLNKLVKA